MSDASREGPSEDEIREAFADAFNRSPDPLAEYSEAFYGLPDPFDYFVETVLENRDTITSDETLYDYRLTYRQWREHMDGRGRHPACPSPQHVKAYIEWRRDIHGNTRRTIKQKLNHLSQAYEFWQADSAFPHPADFNPFELGEAMTKLGDDSTKPFHELSLSELQDAFADVENIMRRAIIGLQLKLGLRAGEVCNLQLQDLHISHQRLRDYYPSLGTHPAVGDYTDVLYVPHDREGNKSSNPRLLPIDEELRWLLLRYLLVRPQVDEPRVFLSRRTFTQFLSKGVNEEWKAAFHPEYGATEERKGITSHFGRHWFSSYCRLSIGMPREQIQYMRGDRIQPMDDFGDAIDEYIHPNYDHVEDLYRNGIFKLEVPMRHGAL